jgi:hypothetical protein
MAEPQALLAGQIVAERSGMARDLHVVDDGRGQALALQDLLQQFVIVGAGEFFAGLQQKIDEGRKVRAIPGLVTPSYIDIG